MKPSVIFSAILSGLAICYARGDFTKAALASIGVLDLAKMTIIITIFGLTAVLIVKGWDRLMRRHRRVVRTVGRDLQRRSRDLGSRAP